MIHYIMQIGVILPIIHIQARKRSLVGSTNIRWVNLPVIYPYYGNIA